MSEVPSIEMTKKNGEIVLVCNSIDCNWEEVAVGPDQIEIHQQWHEDGVPQ